MSKFCLSDATLVKSFESEQSAIRSVRFTPDHAYCLTGGADKTIRLWNPFRGLLLQSFAGHNDQVLDAQGSPDNSNVASAGIDRFVYIWDVLTGRSIRYFRAHMAAVQCLAYHQDGSILASGSLDGRVHLYDLRAHGREPLQTLPEAKDNVQALVINEKQIISGSLDGRVRVYDLRVGQMYEDVVGAGVLSLTESEDKQCLLVSCMDACVRLLDKQNGQILSEYRGHDAGKYKIDCGLIKNDSIVVCGSEDGRVHGWELLSNEAIGQLSHDAHKVSHTLCSDHHNNLITAADSHLYLWSFADL